MQESAKLQAPKKKKKLPRFLIILLVAAVILVAVFLYLRSNVQKTVSSAYLPAQAVRQPITVTVTGTGTVEPDRSRLIASPLRGEILSAPFEVGDHVEKDQVLYIIDAKDAQKAVEQAEIAVEQAKNAVARAEAGVEQTDLAVRQAQVGTEQAGYSVDSATQGYNTLVRQQKDNAIDRQVKANATGTVVKLYVDAGDTVAAGTPIAEILDREHMKLTVPFHAAAAKDFVKGQAATVTVSGTDQTLSGVITDLAAANRVGPGGTQLRDVTIQVTNPGTLSTSSTGTAQVGDAASASVGVFSYAASKQLIATYSGKLERLDIAEGSTVTDGQIVGQFEEKNFQDQIDSAAISVDNAKTASKNADIALSNAQVSADTAQIALADAQLALRSAENNLKNAQDNLDEYTIKAPISGTVVEKHFEEGDELDGQNPRLALIYDLSRLTFTINVSELDVSRVKVGQTVTFTSDALEGMTFTGHVDDVSISGVSVSGVTNYPVTVVIDQGEGLLPGMNVSATILVEVTEDVLTLPVDAIQRPNLVYVPGPGALDAKGQLVDPSKLQSREVVLGRNDSENIEILSGLSEGDTVFCPNASSGAMAQMMGMMGG